MITAVMYYQKIKPAMLPCGLGVQVGESIWKSLVITTPIFVNSYTSDNWIKIYKFAIHRVKLMQNKKTKCFVFYNSKTFIPRLQITVLNGKLDSLDGFPSLIYLFQDEYQIQWHRDGNMHSLRHPCAISHNTIQWRNYGDFVSLSRQIGRSILDSSDNTPAIRNTFRGTVRIGDPYMVQYAGSKMLAFIMIDDYQYSLLVDIDSSGMVGTVVVHSGIGDQVVTVHRKPYPELWQDVMQKYIEIVLRYP